MITGLIFLVSVLVFILILVCIRKSRCAKETWTTKGTDTLLAISRDLDGFPASSTDQKILGLKSDSFVYGETVHDSFSKLLANIPSREDELFCDLGCGAGKALLSTAISHPKLRIRGIELLPSLVTKSNQVRNAVIKSTNRTRSFEVVHGDIIKTSWADADIVYIASTCFQEELLTQLSEKLQLLKEGSRVLMLKLPTGGVPGYKLIETIPVQMSWGKVSAKHLRKQSTSPTLLAKILSIFRS